MKLLRAIVESPYEPNDINVLWIDTSLDGVPVLRKYTNGFWTYVSSSSTTFIVNVDILPEASKQTLGKMYAIPSQNPHEGDTTDEWLTVISYDSDGNPIYSWEQIGQNPDLSQFITKSVNNLENYYLKTQTFTQEEIIQRINESKNLVYLVVDELPQASSETLNSIYLVEDSQQENVYNMYITQYESSTYSWVDIGNTSIALSQYAIKDVDAVEGNIAAFDANGNPVDGGISVEYISQLGQKSYSFAFNGGVSNVGSWDGGGQYYKISDFIPIVGGEVIYGYSNTVRCVVQFYDADKTWISSLNPVNSSMNLVTLTPDIIPAKAVYFRAGTLTANESQSYIHQPCINALDKFVQFVPTLERTTAQAQKVDGIIYSADYTADNVRLNLDVVLPAPSAYVMVKIATPPSATFSIGRRANYTTTVSTYLTGCAYNTWIKVEQQDDLKILRIFNTETSAAATIPVTVLYKTLEDSVEQRLDMLETASVRGKKIVVFGDSLSEFGHDGKTWPMHFAEITGAEMINCAIGGTQIKQRGPLVTLFNESTTYNVGDRVYYKPSTTMKCYNCIAQHTGAWSDSDFEEVQYYVYAYSTLDMVNLISTVCDVNTPIESRFVNVDAAAECVKDNAGDNNLAIIERLKAIDWSTVDAVILMGGRNDYGGTNPGTSGSTDKNTTLGAINEIVRIFLSTYKNISFYYVTPTVNWFNYSSGVGADEDWCDVYVALGASLTCGAFVKLLQTEFEKNHIPVCDLYGTLGWNKWNFSNFFTENDGSHPLLGLRQIATKIAGWMQSNKTFV